MVVFYSFQTSKLSLKNMSYYNLRNLYDILKQIIEHFLFINLHRKKYFGINVRTIKNKKKNYS